MKPRLSSVAAGGLNSPVEGAGATLDAPLSEDDVILPCDGEFALLRVLAELVRR